MNSLIEPININTSWMWSTEYPKYSYGRNVPS